MKSFFNRRRKILSALKRDGCVITLWLCNVMVLGRPGGAAAAARPLRERRWHASNAVRPAAGQSSMEESWFPILKKPDFLVKNVRSAADGPWALVRSTVRAFLSFYADLKSFYAVFVLFFYRFMLIWNRFLLFLYCFLIVLCCFEIVLCCFCTVFLSCYAVLKSFYAVFVLFFSRFMLFFLCSKKWFRFARCEYLSSPWYQNLRTAKPKIRKAQASIKGAIDDIRNTRALLEEGGARWLLIEKCWFSDTKNDDFRLKNVVTFLINQIGGPSWPRSSEIYSTRSTRSVFNGRILISYRGSLFSYREILISYWKRLIL